MEAIILDLTKPQRVHNCLRVDGIQESVALYSSNYLRLDKAPTSSQLSKSGIDTQEPVRIRVIDHACSSEHCMSYQVVAILRLAHRKISADLCNDQPLDACGSRAASVFFGGRRRRRGRRPRGRRAAGGGRRGGRADGRRPALPI